MEGFSAWLRRCIHIGWIRNKPPMKSMICCQAQSRPLSLSPPAGRQDRHVKSKFPLSVSLLKDPSDFHYMTPTNGRPPKLVNSKTDSYIQEIIETYPCRKFSKMTGEPTSLLRIPEAVNQRNESTEKTNSILVRKIKN